MNYKQCHVSVLVCLLLLSCMLLLMMLIALNVIVMLATPVFFYICFLVNFHNLFLANCCAIVFEVVVDVCCRHCSRWL
jgi:hypothetical protein